MIINIWYKFSIAIVKNFIYNSWYFYIFCVFDEKQKMIYSDRNADSDCNYWYFDCCYHT